MRPLFYPTRLRPSALALLCVCGICLLSSLNNASAQRRYYAEDIYYNYNSYDGEYRPSETLEAGVRYLKLGNTYREGRRYNLAQTYLRQGLDIVRARGSRYWEAVGNEYAGLLFRDMGDRPTALDYLRRAEYLYREVLQPMNTGTSIDAVRRIQRDVDLDYGFVRPSRTAADYYTSGYTTASGYTTSDAYSGESYRLENQRLREINRALQVRIADLETRIRYMEQPMVGR